MSKTISEILNKKNQTFIIAEAGSNWKVGTYDEDLKMAMELIETASKAGADAVKFQTYRSETVYVPNAGEFGYIENSKNKDIVELLKNLSMPYEMLEELYKHCNKKKIMFMSTPFSVEDAKQVNQFVKIHKIASYEINHIRLLEYVASTKKPILISTGASTYEEIDFAVNLLNQNNSGPIGILQCTSKYPSPIEALNISVIPHLAERYKVPIGFSDHSLHPIIGPLLAIGKGATIIEKHFTLDRNLEGPDHKFALIPEELSKMIKAIRDGDLAKGSGEKSVLNEEKELYFFAKRAIQATKNISKGEKMQEGYNFDVLRPGNQKRGAEPRFLLEIDGKKSIRNISQGEGILIEDCADE